MHCKFVTALHYHEARRATNLNDTNLGLSCRSVKVLPLTKRQTFKPMATSGSHVHNCKVVTIGEALYDCLADQLGKEKDEVTSWTPYPGGAPANVATALSRLGVQAVLLCALGKDELGDAFVKLLNDRGVDTDHIQRNEHPTRDVLVTRTLEGDRHFAGFGATSTDDYADCFLNASSLPVELISKSQVLVSGTLGLAYPGSRDAILAAVSAAKSDHNTTVIIDINWRPVFWKDSTAAKSTILDFIKVADVLKLTDEEAEWLYGIPAAEALAQPAKILEALPSVQGVLVSAGEKGSSYSFRCPGGKLDVSGEVAVLPVKVEDTTGAGDAYLSGFIFYMLLSGGLKGLMADPGKLLRAVQFAAACGAATCKRAGAIDAQPTVQEVENLLKEAGLNA